MRMSQLLHRSLREAPAEADHEGHALLLRGGFVRQLASGIFTYAPLGLRVLRRIEAILREEMDALGVQEVSMPLVQPAELWRESGRWATVGDEMARFRDRSGRDLCLAMTHEEAATQLVRDQVRSYRQLPLAIYQLQTKFRDEPRARGGLLRVREFTMKDAYSFHAAQEDLDAFYARMHEAYDRIFERCGLDVIAVESDEGMMGGRGAHEFMALLPIGEDTIVLCDACGYRANRQVARSASAGPGEVAAGDACAACGADLRTERGVEVGNIFKLGTRYSESMGATFLDEEGEQRPLVMGSYGIGPGRLLACLAHVHRDEHGLRWPAAVAPFQVVIASLATATTPEVARAAEALYERLSRDGVEVLLDDRDERPGVKFADADLLGAPVRVTVGARGVAGGYAEVARRADRGGARIPLVDVAQALRQGVGGVPG